MPCTHLKKWEIKSTTYRERDEYLDQGWEPIGIFETLGGIHGYHFKRPRPCLECEQEAKDTKKLYKQLNEAWERSIEEQGKRMAASMLREIELQRKNGLL